MFLSLTYFQDNKKTSIVKTILVCPNSIQYEINDYIFLKLNTLFAKPQI